MATRKLGKGLNSLLSGNQAGDSGEAGGPLWVPIDDLAPNPEQPRKDLEKGLTSLSESIRRHGVMQPILVTQLGKGRYQILAGERRWRAARKAGLSTVPVLLREGASRAQERLELALIENIQREDLDPIERALGCRRLMDEYDLTQARVAERLGFERSTVANLVRLLELPEEIQHAVSRETISAGHGRALLRLNGAPAQKEAFDRIVTGDLSVRAAESLCAELSRAKKKPAHKARPRNPAWLSDLQERVTRGLGSRTELRLRQRGGGRLILHFQDLEDLDRLVQRMGLPSELEELQSA